MEEEEEEIRPSLCAEGDAILVIVTVDGCCKDGRREITRSAGIGGLKRSFSVVNGI